MQPREATAVVQRATEAAAAPLARAANGNTTQGAATAQVGTAVNGVLASAGVPPSTAPSAAPAAAAAAAAAAQKGGRRSRRNRRNRRNNY